MFHTVKAGTSVVSCFLRVYNSGIAIPDEVVPQLARASCLSGTGREKRKHYRGEAALDVSARPWLSDVF
jgi:hypothetical protein